MDDASIFLNYGIAGVILFFTYIMFIKFISVFNQLVYEFGAKIDKLGEKIDELNQNILILKTIIERNGVRNGSTGKNGERKVIQH